VSATVREVTRSLPRILAALITALFTAAPAAARSDAQVVAARVVEQWRLAGGDAAALPSRFVFDDETVLVPVPREEDPATCTQIAIVGARGLSFQAKLSDTSADPLSPEEEARGNSHAGVLELRRCDGERPVRHVMVTAQGGRGAIEVVVARSRGALPSLSTVAPERTGGALPPTPDTGALPELAAEGKRAEVAEARARREGATIRARSELPAGVDGAGDVELLLDEGCHRLELFGRDTRLVRAGRRFRLDVDAELRDPASDRILARDRTEAPDAHLETCIGAKGRVALAFVGAPAKSTVLVSHASWPLPARLPHIWGPATRSKMARAMFARRVAVPAHDPVFLGQGSTGSTSFPLSVETGGCYVAVVSTTHGQARSLQIHAFAGARASADERGAAEGAALAAFCVRAHERARVEVFARGPGVGFALAVFRVKSGVWEAGR
jgi:hypothetical protein